MDNQLDLFEGERLRDIGISKAIESAEDQEPGWSSMAYEFLLKYARKNRTFLAEDVRLASSGIVPEPPSKRAWGGIFVRAKKNKIIRGLGYKQVTNPKAHRTPATLWCSL